ncbi:MAG: sulfotransferase domain-containing protein [Pseudomonadota bacterium]
MGKSADLQALKPRRIAYDHAYGRITVTVDRDGLDKGLQASLLLGERMFKPLRQVERDNRIAITFSDVWFETPSQSGVLLLQGAQTMASLVFDLNGADIQGWPEVTGEAATPPALLLCFPRSGSNFAQHVLRGAAPQLTQVSLYQGGRIGAMAQMLKSHALTDPILKRELSTLWQWRGDQARRIVLTRDPRDIFVSAYDYIRHLHHPDLDPASLMDADFVWHFYTGDRRPIIRGHRVKDYPMRQAFKIWCKTWLNRPDVTYVRFEDLVQRPREAFAAITEALSIDALGPIDGLDTLVSQYGDSERRRGQAGGWQDAPALYQPIIDAVNNDLAQEIAALGY